MNINEFYSQEINELVPLQDIDLFYLAYRGISYEVSESFWLATYTAWAENGSRR